MSETQTVRSYETEAAAPCGGGDRHAQGAGAAQADWQAHRYTVGYTYDLVGRRTGLLTPDQLDPCTGPCTLSYRYNATVGTLDTLLHPSATGGVLTTRFTYDAQGRLSQTNYPSTGVAVQTTQWYDADGRVTRHEGPATFDTLAYDAGGRVIAGTTQPPSGGSLTLGFAYTTLGALQWAQGLAPGVTAENVSTDALGTQSQVRDAGMIPDVDRTRLTVVDSTTGRLTGTTLAAPVCPAPGLLTGSCHPAWYVYAAGQVYDPSGNVTETWEQNTDANHVATVSESRSYFSADEQLTYFNRMDGWGPGTGLFDVYRYDALGRRVLTRTRRIGYCNYPCDAFIERTVYDGEQVLAEIRSSGKDAAAAEYLEGEGAVLTGPFADDPNLYGVVLYAHAQGIDQPSQLLKRIPLSAWTALTPHTNWRGAYAYGTDAAGVPCYTSQATCPNWPGYAEGAYGKERGVGPTAYTVWFGNLVRGRKDASGLTYLRNRYYDANTGRFTQQDPIGLAGGLNLYGFAGGDPVNFSDPFGLCPQILTGRPCGTLVNSPLVAANATTASGIGGSECGMTRSQGTKAHTGFDWAAAEGTSVYAPADATVTARRTDEGGLGVFMDLGNSATIQVQHLQEYSDLKEGETKQVAAGTKVGKTGVTGNSKDSGRDPHAHVVTKINGGYANPRAFFGQQPGGAVCSLRW